LLRANLRTHRQKVAYSDNLGTPTAKLDRHIRVADIRVRSTIFLSSRKTMMVVSESGDSLFGGLDIKIIHAPRHGCNPIVILVITAGWGIFRPVVKQQELLALPSLRYSDLAMLWGGVGIRVQTVAELRRALENAAQSSAFVIIEAMTGYRDLSPISIKYIRASAKRALKAAKP